MVDTNVVDFGKYKPEQPQVFAYKCPECGTLHYPAPMICKDCHARRDPSGVLFPSWDKVALGGRCTLLTWTRVYNLPEGFEDRYLLFGIVEFENGLRASGRLLVEDPKTGMELVSKAGVVREKVGEDVYGFMFDRPG
jgi:uncharacterized OB-fold protein